MEEFAEKSTRRAARGGGKWLGEGVGRRGIAAGKVEKAAEGGKPFGLWQIGAEARFEDMKDEGVPEKIFGKHADSA